MKKLLYPPNAGGILKPNNHQLFFYFCLSKTRSGRLHDYCHTIVFEKLRFQSVFRSNENESQKFLQFEGVFEELRFRDGLEWVVGLALEITFFITEVCVLFLIKLSFQISPIYCGRCRS